MVRNFFPTLGGGREVIFPKRPNEAANLTRMRRLGSWDVCRKTQDSKESPERVTACEEVRRSVILAARLTYQFANYRLSDHVLRIKKTTVAKEVSPLQTPWKRLGDRRIYQPADGQWVHWSASSSFTAIFRSIQSNITSTLHSYSFGQNTNQYACGFVGAEAPRPYFAPHGCPFDQDFHFNIPWTGLFMEQPTINHNPRYWARLISYCANVRKFGVFADDAISSKLGKRPIGRRLFKDYLYGRPLCDGISAL